MRIQTIVGLLALLSASVIAQTPSPMQGKWTGIYMSPNGFEWPVELVVADGSGTWGIARVGNAGRNNPCTEKPLSVSVLSQSATDLTIKVEDSKLVQGCMDQAVALKTADGKSLEGTAEGGASVSLKRE